MPVRVLVVDDSATMRMGIKKVVSAMGFEVVAEGANGQQAIDMAKQFQPDLIMLDINMPIKTGIEALDGIFEVHPSAKVIMMTSVSDEGSVDTCIEKGASNYILKTSGPAQITESIRETLESEE